MSTSSSSPGPATSAINPTFLDRSMPPEARNIDEALQDLDSLIAALNSMSLDSMSYDASSRPLTDSSDSGIDYASRGESGVSEYRLKLFQLYRKTIAVSRNRRRHLQLGSVNVNNYNIKPGFWCPVVDSCMESVKFVRNSLAVIRDYHVSYRATLNGDSNYSSRDRNLKNLAGDCSSNSSSSNNSSSGSAITGGMPQAADNVLPPSPSPSPLPSSASTLSSNSNSNSTSSLTSYLTRGRLISLHTGHGGWPTASNLEDLASVLSS